MLTISNACHTQWIAFGAALDQQILDLPYNLPTQTLSNSILLWGCEIVTVTFDNIVHMQYERAQWYCKHTVRVPQKADWLQSSLMRLKKGELAWIPRVMGKAPSQPCQTASSTRLQHSRPLFTHRSVGKLVWNTFECHKATPYQVFIM